MAYLYKIRPGLGTGSTCGQQALDDSRGVLGEKTKNTFKRKCFFSGGSPGTRTRDPLIKSQVLYQLS